MALYPNILQEFRKELEKKLKLQDVVDTIVSEKLITRNQYCSIWERKNGSVRHLLDIILKNARSCHDFIFILQDIPKVRNIAHAMITTADNVRKCVILGGFPEFTKNFVMRNSIASTVKNEILQLKFGFNKMLVIWGLSGFGKSYLVNQVLQCKRCYEHSGGAMFWINLGQYEDTSNVICPLWGLYRKMVKISEHDSLEHRPNEVESLKDEINSLFVCDKLKDAIIVLDDVKSKEVLEAFNFSCKLVVTTQDRKTVDHTKANFIQVTKGLTSEESIELLKKSLQTELSLENEKLAHNIHNICKGYPMILNIIGSILELSKEEAILKSSIWESIIEEINEERLFRDVKDRVIYMIDKCVNRLNEKTQKYFYSLAIFPQQVNITPEILMKLWDRREIRSVMVELEDKSLVVSFFHEYRKSYIYSIHSLVYAYLRQKTQDENMDLTEYHKKMISLYDDSEINSHQRNSCTEYIYGYYGFHAKHANLIDNFQIYFNLSFIENKIKYVGSNDLLTDYDIYKDFITKKDPEMERKIDDFRKCIDLYSAHLHVSPETNIIQFAIAHLDENSEVHKQAMAIAKRNIDQVYFKIVSYSKVHRSFPILSMNTNISSISFLNCSEVLVATADGGISTKAFNYQTTEHFDGHSDEVVSLHLSPDKKRFISISKDSTARLWKLVETLDPQSPKYKQKFWKDIHLHDERKDVVFKMKKTDYIVSVAFPHDSSMEILTSSYRGNIVRWSTITLTPIMESAERGIAIPFILYSHDMKQVICVCNNRIMLFSIDKFIYDGQFGDLKNISNLLLTPKSVSDSNLVAINGSEVQLWDYKERLLKILNVESQIICSSVVDNHLLLGLKNHTICMYDFHLGKKIFLNNYCGLPSALHKTSNSVVFIRVENESLQRCELSLQAEEKPIVLNLSVFCCHWEKSAPLYPVVRPDNTVFIYQDRSTAMSVIQEIKEKITCSAFSTCGKFIIFGTANGSVCYYNYKKRKTIRLNFGHQAITMVKSFEYETDNLNSVDSNDVNGIVLAASARHIIVIDQHEKTFEVSSRLLNMFYLYNYLIVIDINGEVTVRSLSDNSQNEKWADLKDAQIMSAEMYKSGKLRNFLAITYVEHENYFVKILKINLHDNLPLEIVEKKTLELDHRPTSLCFSYKGNILVVGCSNGDIEIFSVDGNFKGETLSLHKKPVEQVLFSATPEPILVSVGDQIAWWNLKQFEEDSNKAESHSLESVRKRKFSKTLHDLNVWNTKKVHSTVPCLLASTNLHGKQLKYVSASKDFKTFLIIDVNGNIYKMDLLQPS